VLTQPAIPPRRDPNIVVEPRKPQVSIAIPPFQPMGVYSQLIAPYQHNQGTPGVVSGTFATPPMRVVVRVRETQLTGSTNQGVVPMIDPVPPANAPRISDITPAAFRDPATGKLHLYWASNRPDPAGRPNSFYLYQLDAELGRHANASKQYSRHQRLAARSAATAGGQNPSVPTRTTRTAACSARRWGWDARSRMRKSRPSSTIARLCASRPLARSSSGQARSSCATRSTNCCSMCL
jgi:hypothetical protein